MICCSVVPVMPVFGSNSENEWRRNLKNAKIWNFKQQSQSRQWPSKARQLVKVCCKHNDLWNRIAILSCQWPNNLVLPDLLQQEHHHSSWFVFLTGNSEEWNRRVIFSMQMFLMPDLLQEHRHSSRFVLLATAVLVLHSLQSEANRILNASRFGSGKQR